MNHYLKILSSGLFCGALIGLLILCEAMTLYLIAYPTYHSDTMFALRISVSLAYVYWFIRVLRIIRNRLEEVRKIQRSGIVLLFTVTAGACIIFSLVVSIAKRVSEVAPEEAPISSIFSYVKE